MCYLFPAHDTYILLYSSDTNKKRKYFSPSQKEMLLERFSQNSHPRATEMVKIANQLSVHPKRVRVMVILLFQRK